MTEYILSVCTVVPEDSTGTLYPIRGFAENFPEPNCKWCTDTGWFCGHPCTDCEEIK